jgi:hypothetical protein
MFAMFLYLTLYLQTTLGLSPLQTGLRFLPTTVVSFFVSALAGNLTERIPVKILFGVGLALVGAGLLLMRGLTAYSHWTDLLPGLIGSGAGIGLVNPALASTAIGVVPPARSGMASGINSTFRQIGVATGIAVLGAIFESNLSSKLAPELARTALAGRTAEVAHAVAAGGSQSVLARVPAPDRAQAAVLIHGAFASALNDILLVGAIVALVGAVLGFVLVRSQDFAAYQVRDAAPAPAGA